MHGEDYPIAAIATALVPSAIAVVRCSGRDSVRLLSTRFSRPAVLTAAGGHTLHHGAILDSAGRRLDDVVVGVYREPRSYTGEEAAEVYCHGSPAGVRRVYRALLDAGFHPAEPGEYTRRAFLNGKIDLTRAEAVNEVVRARTEYAHALAMDRLTGAVERESAAIRRELVEHMAALAIQLDYPEEETGPVPIDLDSLAATERRVRVLAATWARGRLYQEGARVAIVGRTNAGKSSLFNRLLRHDRSIVSDVHGTTRDYVEALIDLEGIPVRLFDTAGLRSYARGVEEEGIRRTRTIVAASQLVLYVAEAPDGPTVEDAALIASLPADVPVVLALNKCDLSPAEGAAPACDRPAMRVSALSGEGIDALGSAIAERLLERTGADADAAAVIDSERQYELLERAADALSQTARALADGVSVDAAAVDLQEALEAIGQITGEVASSEILDAMFAGFCVGK